MGIIFALCLGTAQAADKPAAEDEQAPPRDTSMLIRLLRSDAVQDELKLNPQQRSAIAALVADVEYPLFVVRDYPVGAKREPLGAIADQVDAVLDKTLTDKQQGRLFEIVLRAHGWPAVLAPHVAETLKLSPKQTADIRRILEESAGGEPQAGPSLDEKLLKLLSETQKSELTRMLGEPFDFARVPQVACPAPELRDVSEWINTEPVALESLRGQVVALHFFAFACSNCVNNQPHYKAWHQRYGGQGVTVLGIHTPETARERIVDNLRADVKARQIAYPIAVDAQASNWKAWSNNMWPAVYLIDKRGMVRYWWYGELNWQGAKGEEFMRERIEELLAEEG